MEDENALAQARQTDVTTQQDQRLGFEEPIDRTDLIIPRAKLFQGTPTEQDQFPNVKPGSVINSLTAEPVGSLFVPCFKWTEVVRFNARNQKDPTFDPSFGPGAMIWKCTDPTDPRWKEGEFGPNGEKPTAMRTMNFLCYFIDQPMPIILSFAKTSYRAGKKLLSIAQFSGQDMFSKRYRLGTKREESDGNIYYVLTVDMDGNATEQEYATAKKWYQDLAKAKEALNIHEPTTPDFTE